MCTISFEKVASRGRFVTLVFEVVALLELPKFDKGYDFQIFGLDSSFLFISEDVKFENVFPLLLLSFFASCRLFFQRAHAPSEVSPRQTVGTVQSLFLALLHCGVP